MPEARAIHARTESTRLPAHPCPNHDKDRVSRPYGYQSIQARAYGYHCIHAQTLKMFVFREHTVSRASKPRAYGDQGIRTQTIITFVFREHTVTRHPCPNHKNVRVFRAYGYQCIHAQTESIRLPAHPCTTMITFVFRDHTVTRASIYPNQITFVFREHTVTSASMDKP